MSAKPAVTPMVESDLPLTLWARGKVRDIYLVGSDRLLLVATDRISAFDVVLNQPIPGKGAVLNLMSAAWLRYMENVTPHHMISVDPVFIADAVPELRGCEELWAGRSMLVYRAPTILIECVVRGYITGSAWAEYKKCGTLAGEALPEGLQESQKLEQPIFSPATKAETGHDENITFERMCEIVGEDVANDLRGRSLVLYERGRSFADFCGIILADTKFEFGTLPDGRIILIDEVLTPDSSRFWPRDGYEVGRGQPSLDKQPVRDYLQKLVGRGEWNKEPPAPDLSPEVVRATTARYEQVFEMITGYRLDRFPMRDPQFL